MSISVALANALSGLTASSRRASIASGNIANALTEGYGRRSLETSPRSFSGGGGVNIDGVIRHVDDAVLHERRGITATHAEADTLAAYQQRMERLLGGPDDTYALTALYARFESALIAAASRPDLSERQTSLLQAAKDVAGGFAEVQTGIQTLRQEADAEIGATVERINALLSQVAEANIAITRARYSGGDSSGLEDLRQIAIDELSEIVPIRTAPRDGGALALFTPGGAILLDGLPAEIGFSRSNVITPHQTLSASLLSGLSVNGQAITPGGTGPLAGGRLSALFDIRDDLAVAAQTQLDAAARDLAERFQDPGLDTTRGLGDPGLFTDGGAVFTAVNEVGLAGRLNLNALVDPDQGGALWRLRDGLGAVAPGPTGEAGLIQDLHGALTALRVPASGGFGSSGVSASTIAASILSQAGNDRRLAEDRVSFTAARRSEIEERYLSDGVDTDEEMQRLILIEQNYAANARMVQTIDEMMNILLRI